MNELSYYEQDLLFVTLLLVIIVVLTSIAFKLYNGIMTSYCCHLEVELRKYGYFTSIKYDHMMIIHNINTKQEIRLSNVIPYVSKSYIINKCINKFDIVIL